MSAVWEKMQVKDRERFLVLWVPEEAEADVAELAEGRVVERRRGTGTYDGIVLFVKDEAGIEAAAKVLDKHAAGDDTLVWILYPKKSSKKYAAAINRDLGWDPVLKLGWDGVRQVAFDEDWSALRFRPTSAIRNYTRKKRIGSSER